MRIKKKNSRECRRRGKAVNDSHFLFYYNFFFDDSFYRLKPFTSYQFRVKATNDIGDSEYSGESEAITTLQDGRSRSDWSSAAVGTNLHVRILASN